VAVEAAPGTGRRVSRPRTAGFQARFGTCPHTPAPQAHGLGRVFAAETGFTLAEPGHGACSGHRLLPIRLASDERGTVHDAPVRHYHRQER